MSLNSESISEESLPEWFRIGDGEITLGVYPKENHSTRWPLGDTARILYDAEGTSLYFPENEESSSSIRGLVEEEISEIAPEEAWAELKGLALAEKLSPQARKGFTFARMLLERGDDPRFLSYGLAVARAVLLFVHLRRA